MQTETLALTSRWRVGKAHWAFLGMGLILGMASMRALEPVPTVAQAAKAVPTIPRALEGAQLKADLEAQSRLLRIIPEKGEFYWPKKVLERPATGHTFFQVWRPFDPQVDVTRIGEVPAALFESMLLSSVPLYLRPKMEKFLLLALKMAEQYQVDPFWALAVMCTESQFNPSAISPRKAIGLMQIMPDTGHFLAHRLYRPVSQGVARDITLVPSINVEMGVFYLRKLVRMFRHDYALATMAYNLGPYAVKKRLAQKRSLSPGDIYLDKVSSYYKMLSAPYRAYMRGRPRAYTLSFVVKSRRAKSFPTADQVLALSTLPDARTLLADAF